MFGRSRRKKSDDRHKAPEKQTSPELAPVTRIEPLDRRAIGGSRIICQCDFAAPNSDPFKSHTLPIKGLMILNVRGCSIYPSNDINLEYMTVETMEEWFINKRLVIKAMNIQGSDGECFTMRQLGIKGIRFVEDENGEGIVFKFINLAEEQLDQLQSIVQRYE